MPLLKQEGKGQGAVREPIFTGMASGSLPAVSMLHTALRLRDSCKGPGARSQPSPKSSPEPCDHPKVLSVVKIKDGMERSLLEGHRLKVLAQGWH